MTEPTHFMPVAKASREIVEILKRLETEIGREVMEIGIKRIDITTMKDVRVHVRKHVAIDLAPDEISDWG